MAIKGISEETQRGLLLSVGSHRSERPLSPIEIGRALESARQAGTSLEELRTFLHLEDDSVLRRFLSLLSLGPELSDYVDWKRTSVTIPFTAASEIAKLPQAHHKVLADAIIRHSFSTFEVKQLIQLLRRSNKTVDDCVAEVLRFRPTTETHHLFIGAISNPGVRKRLGEMSQVERDELLRRVLLGVLTPGTQATGRLSNERFSVVGGQDLAQQINAPDPPFEKVVSDRLQSVLGEL